MRQRLPKLKRDEVKKFISARLQLEPERQAVLYIAFGHMDEPPDVGLAGASGLFASNTIDTLLKYGDIEGVPALALFLRAIETGESNKMQVEQWIAAIERDDQPSSSLTVVIFAANPLSFNNSEMLRVGAEVTAIQDEIRLTDRRDLIKLEVRSATRPEDLSKELLRYKPHIVHFAGHGDSSGNLILEDSMGNPVPITTETLKSVFETLKDNIRCVVLNTCYADLQANALASVIDCVIGIRSEVEDDVAIKFAAGFYRGLGYKRSLKSAFEIACNEIPLSPLNSARQPQLLTREGLGLDPRDIFL